VSESSARNFAGKSVAEDDSMIVRSPLGIEILVHREVSETVIAGEVHRARAISDLMRSRPGETSKTAIDNEASEIGSWVACGFGRHADLANSS
jgi:hypothetical protein